MCDFEHECPFDIKRQENILCKIPSDSNARNIILYCEFSNAVLGHSIRTFSGMNEKTQSYIFTSGYVLDVCVPRVPWRSTWKLMCCFLIVTNARQILTMVCKVLDVPFEWGIYRYVLSTRYLINQRYWNRLGIFRDKILSRKFVYGRDGGHGSKHVLASRP